MRLTTGRETVGRRRVEDRQEAPERVHPAPAGGADSALFGHPTIAAELKSGVDVSVTARLDPKVKTAISSIPTMPGQAIVYTDAVYEERVGRWVSRAEVAEILFTAIAAQKKTNHLPGRLVVRRIPTSTPAAGTDNRPCSTRRFHGFFTATDPEVADTVAADKTHRGHAIIEQVHSDLKHSVLADQPSASFATNAAWLVLAVMAFNLTRTAATITGPELVPARPPRQSGANSSRSRPGSHPRDDRVTPHLPNLGPG